MIESIIESPAWVPVPRTGTISIAVSSTALVGVGTAFDTELTAGDIIFLVDDAGVPRQYTIDSITDATNAVLKDAGRSVASGVSYAHVDVGTGRTVAFFLSDNTVLKKPLIQVTTDFTSALATDTGLKQISVNEGILVKSIYVRLPYQYTFADTILRVDFSYLSNTGGFLAAIPSIGEDGTINLPIENIEIPINAYIPPRTAGTTGTWQLSAKLTGLGNVDSVLPVVSTYRPAQVSQVDAPDALNGQYLPVYVGARVLHAGAAFT